MPDTPLSPNRTPPRRTYFAHYCCARINSRKQSINGNINSRADQNTKQRRKRKKESTFSSRYQNISEVPGTVSRYSIRIPVQTFSSAVSRVVLRLVHPDKHDRKGKNGRGKKKETSNSHVSSVTSHFCFPFVFLYPNF